MAKPFFPTLASETIPCPVCGGSEFDGVTEAGDYEYQLPGAFFVSRCRNCGLVLQNPRPPFVDILRYYTEEYEPYHAVGSSFVQAIRHFVLVRPRANLYRRLIGREGSIVDVGCSVGGLLHELSAQGNWQLTGVEPVAEVAAMGNAQGLHIIPKPLEEAGIPNASVDLAIMNHVLEHLPDPAKTVASVFEMLKPGGYLAGEIPSPRCVERTIFGRYWGGYHLPRHLTFFSPRHIRRFLENTGFQDASVSYQQQPSSSLLSFCNYLRSRKTSPWLLSIFSPHSLFWLTVLTPVTTVLKLLGSAPIIHFQARKPLS
jgi:SAM-dependent methyltransferase